MDSGEPLGDVRALYESFASAPRPGLFATPGEYEVQKVFVVLRPRKPGAEPVEKRPKEELPDALKDNIILLPGPHLDLDEMLHPIRLWPFVQHIFLDDPDKSFDRLADHIAATCKVDPASGPFLISRVLSALEEGEGVDIWLAEETLAGWLGNGLFCQAIHRPGRAVNFFVCAIGQSLSVSVIEQMDKLAASTASNRPVRCYFCPASLDRSIALFENKSLVEEVERSQIGRESLLDTLARLFVCGSRPMPGPPAASA